MACVYVNKAIVLEIAETSLRNWWFAFGQFPPDFDQAKQSLAAEFLRCQHLGREAALTAMKDEMRRLADHCNGLLMDGAGI